MDALAANAFLTADELQYPQVPAVGYTLGNLLCITRHPASVNQKREAFRALYHEFIPVQVLEFMGQIMPAGLPPWWRSALEPGSLAGRRGSHEGLEQHAVQPQILRFPECLNADRHAEVAGGGLVFVGAEQPVPPREV